MIDTRGSTLAFGLTVAALLAAPVAGPAQAGRTERPADAGPRPQPDKKGYVPVNGLNYYYEVHGQGQPLLLLHGGLGSIDMFGPLLPMLAKERQVIAVDLHGHGRTALGDRPISLIDIGNDLATLLTKLGYDTVDVLGYSFGAGAGFRLAVQHPSKVRRLAVVSAPYAQDGFYPEMLPQQAQVGAAMAEAMKETPMYQSYVAAGSASICRPTGSRSCRTSPITRPSSRPRWWPRCCRSSMASADHNHGPIR
jgi:pimeloyl-ACP methyl ester carboxylesterase